MGQDSVIKEQRLPACVRTGNRIVQEAREWIGTPFHRGQSVKGLGCDCGGLCAGVLRNVGALTPAEASEVTSEAPIVVQDGLLAARIVRFLEPVPFSDPLGFGQGLPGDVLLFRIGETAQHLGIGSGEGTMIHALMTLEVVAECTLSDGWRKRIAGVYRLREAR